MLLNRSLPFFLALLGTAAALEHEESAYERFRAEFGYVKPCGFTELRVFETLNFIKNMVFDPNVNPNVDPRPAGDYDTWEDELFIFHEPPASTGGNGSPDSPASLTEKIGMHYGRCMWTGDFNPVHCDGTFVIDHPDIGKGTVTIMGASPTPIAAFQPINPDIQFTITGGSGDFAGAYGQVFPGWILHMSDPDNVSEQFPGTGIPASPTDFSWFHASSCNDPNEVPPRLSTFQPPACPLSGINTFQGITYGLEFQCKALKRGKGTGKSKSKGQSMDKCAKYGKKCGGKYAGCCYDMTCRYGKCAYY